MEQNTNIIIKGMSCASCVNRVEKALQKNPGIISASVNLATEKAKIHFDDKQLNRLQIVDIINSAGYQASLPTDQNSHQLPKDQSKELLLIIISFLFAAPLALPMLVEPFGIHLMPSPWLQWLLSTPIQFFIGARFYRSAWGAIKAKTGNMELLVAVGTTAAYGLSIYLFFKQAHHLYFESSAVVITLVLLGKYLETRAKQQTTSAIRSLEKLRPLKATTIRNGIEVEIPLEELKIGDLVIIKPGQAIPIDGKIIQGITQVNESLLTGESLPVDKNVNDVVVGGSINGDGLIRVVITAIGQETMLSRIIRLVEEAQAEKAPIQKLVDKISAYFVPTVLAIALTTIIITGLLTHDWEMAIIHGVAVLVIACPCALGLATPTSIMVGTGAAARAGILIKDAEALELSHSLTTIAFDKTGTLTEGKPSLSLLQSYDGTKENLLSIMAGIQQGSEHPLAMAIIKEAKQRGVTSLVASNIQAIPGKGIQAQIEGQTYLFGSKRLLLEHNLSTQQIAQDANQQEKQGETVSYLINLSQKKVLGLASFKDAIKDNAKQTIQMLKDLKIQTIMLTGDNRDSANAVANELGIDQVHAEILPQQKTEIIQELKRQGQIVGMVGDGLNDAPALASAHVGMAMSTGTDVAMHTAGITLMRGNPLLIPDAISISRKTYSKIKQNLFWAFIYNVVGIPLAALGHLSPVIAGTAMALSSFCVVTNSLLLKRWKASSQKM